MTDRPKGLAHALLTTIEEHSTGDPREDLIGALLTYVGVGLEQGHSPLDLSRFVTALRIRPEAMTAEDAAIIGARMAGPFIPLDVDSTPRGEK